MDIKKRLSALEKKCAVPDERKVLYRKLYPLVMADPETYGLALALAEGYPKNPDLYERMSAGESITDEELSQAGIDPDLMKLLAAKIEEITNRLEAESEKA